MKLKGRFLWLLAKQVLGNDNCSLALRDLVPCYPLVR